MTSILLSRQPQIVADILNGKSDILVCKKFPADYVGWVYVYCTKLKNRSLVFGDVFMGDWVEEYTITYGINKKRASKIWDILDGKVVARFWCDNVEKIYFKGFTGPFTDSLKPYEISKKGCIDFDDLWEYCDCVSNKYVVHISKIEVFDKPKALWQFEKNGSFTRPDIKCKKKDRGICNHGWGLKGYSGCDKARLTKAPKNYCYIEGEE